MKDNLVILFVVPERAWVQERLVVPGRSDMSYSGFMKKSTDPIICAFVIGLSLKCSWSLVFKVTGIFHWVSTSKDLYQSHWVIKPIPRLTTRMSQPHHWILPRARRRKYTAAALVKAPSKATSIAIMLAIL